jgi:hydroxypyruvate isomerase
MRIGPYEVVANLSLLFPEVPFLERFAAARANGFELVECWWPFADARPDTATVDAFLGAIDRARVRLAGMNLYAGDMAGGERGVAAHPERVEEFRSSLSVAQRVADRTGCGVFNTLYGQRPADRATAVANVREAMTALDGTILLEPLTVGENGDYPITTCADVEQLIDEVRATTTRTNVALLFDTYHLTNNGADMPAAIERYGHRIGHVQFADSPGRHEPGTGNVDFASVVASLQQHGYRGNIAAEYRPTTTGFDWIGRL